MVNKSPSSGYVRADKDCRSQPLRAFYRSAQGSASDLFMGTGVSKGHQACLNAPAGAEGCGVRCTSSELRRLNSQFNGRTVPGDGRRGTLATRLCRALSSHTLCSLPRQERLRQIAGSGIFRAEEKRVSTGVKLQRMEPVALCACQSKAAPSLPPTNASRASCLQEQAGEFGYQFYIISRWRPADPRLF
jgi:hypothetical protein